MNKWTLLVVLPLACVSLGIGAKEPTSALLDMTWLLSLDADGHITRIATSDTRAPKLHEPLEKEIRSWRFSPGKVDGQPAVTDTQLRMLVAVSLADSGFEVRVLRAATGVGYRKTRTPVYPNVSAWARKQGLVLLKVRYDESGSVVDAAPYEDAPTPDGALAHAATVSVKRWTFEPEVVGGHPLAGTALVPICFHLYELAPPDCNWKRSGSSDNMSGSQAVALDPAAKLETDVAGRTL